MPEIRKLALFLDGTWNTLNDNTNVWRMKSLLTTGDPNQLCYYSQGVGTTRGERVSGGMFGYGLDREVTDAYEWLIEHYEVGDRLFIFGFSRGAFTARSLAGFIAKCGLLTPGAPLSLDQLYSRYRLGTSADSIRELKNRTADLLSQEETWLLKYSRDIPVYFQGVWDTVGALGLPFGNLAHVSRSQFKFLETDLRINYSFAYHALAIDEHRVDFAPTLWTKVTRKSGDNVPPRPLTEVEQRWFVGAHADVGGGYEDGVLAQLPLRWLQSKAEAHGLRFRNSVALDGDEVHADVHDSFAQMGLGLYPILRLGRRYYRTLGAAPIDNATSTKASINETIDGSVFKRWQENTDYRPANLERWASQYRVEVSALGDSVRADDPRAAVPEDIHASSAP